MSPHLKKTQKIVFKNDSEREEFYLMLKSMIDEAVEEKISSRKSHSGVRLNLHTFIAVAGLTLGLSTAFAGVFWAYSDNHNSEKFVPSESYRKETVEMKELLKEVVEDRRNYVPKDQYNKDQLMMFQIFSEVKDTQKEMQKDVKELLKRNADKL